MIRPLIAVIAVAAVVTVGLSLAGCGSLSPNGATGTIEYVTTQAVLSEYLSPFEDSASQTPRWLDVGDNPYVNTFQSFSYLPDTILLQYTTQETPLMFAIAAPVHSLKPNFCYQVKLEGPSKPWESDPSGNDFVNAQLGYNGRWWCDTCNATLDDRTVSMHMRRSHYVKGYLLFGFIVTDGDGRVDQTVVVDSSYHVVWKTSQRSRGANDGPNTLVNRTIAPDGWAYDTSYGIAEQLYAEWEPDRPLPGDLALAAGAYNGVQLRLTEESFHSTHPLGGNWRTVLVADGLSFVIGEEPSPSESHDLAVTAVDVPRKPGVGQVASVAVTVLNEGTGPEAPVTVSLHDDTAGLQVGEETVVSLASGGTATVTFDWTPSATGVNVLIAEVASVPDEIDLADNTRAANVRVFR